MTEKAQNDSLINDTITLISNAQELLNATAEQTDQKTKDIRKQVTDRLIKTKSDLIQLQNAAIEKAKIASKATDEYVHQNPWKSVGIAGTAGVLIGALLSLAAFNKSK